jgi:hypothetical protein
MPMVLEDLPAMHPMTTSDLPLQRIGRGKVRDVYTVDAELLLLVATDRVSAFDVVMGQAVEGDFRSGEPSVDGAFESRPIIKGRHNGSSAAGANAAKILALGSIESSNLSRNAGSSYTRPGSIELPKVLNQQFRKHSHLSRGVVPRRSDNENSDFGERISIHERYQAARRQVFLDQEFRQRGYAEPGDGRRRKSQPAVRLESSLRVHGDRLVSINEDPGLRALHETFMREELFRRFGSAALLDIFGAADELATDRRDLPRDEGRVT